MTHLEAYALKATGSPRALAVPSILGLTAASTPAQGRFVGLTGEDPASRTTWIHVGYEGEWHGHRAGPFTLSADTFAQCIAAFDELETPPQVDYGHGSLYESDGLPKPAAGYVVGLEIREDGLWAQVELTTRAASMVKAGEYRFCSGVFVWDEPDRVTGEPIPCQLDSIGLTNRPFVDGQHAIRLSRRVGALSMEITKKDLLAKLDALVEGDTITEKDLGALMAFMQAQSGDGEAAEAAEEAAESVEATALAMPPAAMAETPPEAAVIEEAAATEDMDAAAMINTKIAELTGLDNAAILASLEANADGIKAAFLGGDGGTASLSADVKDQTIAALSRELATHRAEAAKRADAALVAEVDALAAEGKVLPSAKPQMLALARRAPAEFRKLASALPVVVPMGTDAPPPKAGDSAIVTAVTPENLKSHPRYAALAAHYADPKNPYSRNVPKSGPAREKFIDHLVLGQLSREQPITG